MKLELKQHFQIESARSLPKLPHSHPCAHVHGHSFKIIITLLGDINPNLGWVRDYHEVTAHMAPLLKQLDHQLLNNVPGLENPTSEHLAIWIYERASKIIPELIQVTIQETPTTECSFPALYKN